MQKFIVSLALFGFVMLCSSCEQPGLEDEDPYGTTPGIAYTAPAPLRSRQFKPTVAYYVATDGNDVTGDGSASKPWATARHAFETTPKTGGFEIVMKTGVHSGLGYINGIVYDKPVLLRAELPYRTVLKGTTGHRAAYITKSKNIIIADFEIAGNPGYTGSVSSNAYLLQIETSDKIILENNIIHDSYNNDLLKLNEHSDSCEIRGNVFYNANDGGDEHIDANSVYNTIIEDNIFFNDYAASGRALKNITFAYVLFKSSSSTDLSTASHHAIIRRNVFTNWWGKPDQSYLSLGEDGKPFHEITNVEIYDNLFLNNKTRDTPNSDGVLYVNRLAGALSIKNAKDVSFHHNTITGIMQHSWHGHNGTHDGFFGYMVRLSRERGSPAIENVSFTYNILNSPTVEYHGTKQTLGYIASGTPDMVTGSIILDGNLYYAGGADLLNKPVKDLVLHYTKDENASFEDPKLETNLDELIVPVWKSGEQKFADGSSRIEDARMGLIQRYGTRR